MINSKRGPNFFGNMLIGGFYHDAEPNQQSVHGLCLECTQDALEGYVRERTKPDEKVGEQRLR